jgi:imidazolonepropionase-like amidohydrolase
MANSVIAVAQGAAEIVRLGGRVSTGAHQDRDNLQWEIQTFVLGGMSPLDALRCATLFGAEAIGYGDDLGSIEPRKLADMVVLGGNPLTDIRQIADVRYVVANGVVWRGKELKEVWPDTAPPLRPAAGN